MENFTDIISGAGDNKGGDFYMKKKNRVFGFLFAILLLAVLSASSALALETVTEEGGKTFGASNGFSARMWISQGATYESIMIDETTKTVTIKNLTAEKAYLNNTGNYYTFVFDGLNKLGNVRVLTTSYLKVSGPGSYLLADNFVLYSGHGYLVQISVEDNTSLYTEKYQKSNGAYIMGATGAVRVSSLGAAAVYYTKDPIPGNISDITDVVLEQEEFPYSGEAVTPGITVYYREKILEEGTDYDVTFKNNRNAGTAELLVTGKENFSGSITRTFKITKIDLSSCQAVLTDEPLIFTGKAQKPAIVVKNGQTVLKEGTDYTLTYKNNKAVGTGKAVIKGIGNYAGKQELAFKITYPGKGTVLKAKNGTKYLVVKARKTVSYKAPASKLVTTVTIPAAVKIEGVKYTVVSVDANALKNCRKLKKVTIGENVTAIGNNVFQNCKALTAVTIPAAVRSIGKSAFQGCSKLKEITFNTTKLTSSRVGANAFKGTAKKAVVKVPKSKVKTYKKLLLARGLHKTAIVE